MARFSDAQVAVALRDAKPAPGVPLPTLRVDERATAPADLHEATSVLAAPQRALSLNVNARDALGFRPGLLAVRDARSALLLQGPEGWDLHVEGSVAAAIERLLPELGVDGGPATGPRLTLDHVGFAALVAAADVLQHAKLQARLDRRHLPPPELTARALERSLAHGLATGDARWAVCATRWLAPVSLKGARGKMKAGLEAIQGPALEVAHALTEITGGAGLTALEWAGGARNVRGHAVVLATRNGGWWCEWSGVPVAPHVKIAPIAAADLRTRLVGWL